MRFGYLYADIILKSTVQWSLKLCSHYLWLGCWRPYLGDFLSFRMRPVAPFPRHVDNLQQSIGTGARAVLKSLSVDSLTLDFRVFTDISAQRSSHPYSNNRSLRFHDAALDNEPQATDRRREA
ncbi:hypothetical protein AVEN_274348-1 [Araneus ventricosus]|uniref:Uncharacterized protein n=1 Tax=Araneus ventricosus TaxID=182803 RepID=A0A4Y2GAQ9_ARAVE|nr:hypothetical protein AVEN_274348-1 [Araneus ventricosus]